MKKQNLILFLVLGLSVILPATPSSALTFNLNTVITGSSPEPPDAVSWLTAVFTNDGPNRVLLSLSANGLASGSGQFVGYWLFNVVDTISDYTIEPLNANRYSIIQSADGVGSNNSGADSSGEISGFDLGFYFSTANNYKFNAGEELNFIIIGAGITGESFNTTNSSGYYTAAHVQGPTVELSRVITTGEGSQPTPVPEPATMLLLGTGLVGMAAFGRKRLLY